MQEMIRTLEILCAQRDIDQPERSVSRHDRHETEAQRAQDVTAFVECVWHSQNADAQYIIDGEAISNPRAVRLLHFRCRQQRMFVRSIRNRLIAVDARRFILL